jgi:hypothetical protein
MTKNLHAGRLRTVSVTVPAFNSPEALDPGILPADQESPLDAYLFAYRFAGNLLYVCQF